MRATLVCEGACNPGLTDVDEELRTLRRHDYQPNRSERVCQPPESVMERLRKFVHTEHTYIGVLAHPRDPKAVWERWKCQVCQAERNWGCVK